MKFVKLIVLLCAVGLLEARVELERTFAMIKPYAVQQGKADEIMSKIQQAGFVIIAMKKMSLTSLDVYELYEEHVERRWFKSYARLFIGLPAVLMVLEKDNAIEDWDNYKKVIRASYFANHKKNNVVHGSDSKKAAEGEIALFFKD